MTISASDQLYRAILDAYPSPVFIVDEDVRIQEVNQAAADFRTPEAFEVLGLRAGDAFHCLHANRSADGCGTGQACEDCVIRQSVSAAFLREKVTRRRTKVSWSEDDQVRDFHLFVTTVPFQYQDRDLALLVLEDFTELMELKELIPICASCKKIRTDSDLWEQLEAYFKHHLDVDFSHGLCPECTQEYMRQLNKPNTK
jgi:PAS domain-containing protein